MAQRHRMEKQHTHISYPNVRKPGLGKLHNPDSNHNGNAKQPYMESMGKRHLRQPQRNRKQHTGRLGLGNSRKHLIQPRHNTKRDNNKCRMPGNRHELIPTYLRILYRVLERISDVRKQHNRFRRPCNIRIYRLF